jgi:hypothetical protein
MYIPVDGNSNLVRNSVTNAIVNINCSEYNSYIENRNLSIKKSEKIDKIESQLNLLKDEISEIKHLLREVIKND